MPLVGQPFANTFTFTRPIAAPVRNDAGDVVTAAIDAPRFDHDVDGNPKGLLVEMGEGLGQADRCRVVAGDWEFVGPGTVLHEYEVDGTIVRSAAYSASVRATVNAVLATAAHHRIIAAVPGHLRNRGGYVRYREFDWALPGAIGTGVAANQVVGDGSTADRALIEG